VTFTNDLSNGSITLGTSTLALGSATISTASLTPGSHTISATYGGGSGWNGNTASVVVTVQAPATLYYVSMGDSPATGVGAPPGQGYVDDVLAYEQHRLPGLVAARFGCGGATTTTVLKGGGGCSYPEGSQLAAVEPFLQANPGQVAFITINVGANDVAGCFSASGVDPT
jgi:lysophospholipase L1-like esterase